LFGEAMNFQIHKAEFRLSYQLITRKQQLGLLASFQGLEQSHIKSVRAPRDTLCECSYLNLRGNERFHCCLAADLLSVSKRMVRPGMRGAANTMLYQARGSDGAGLHCNAKENE
jgi:hypothetical protein